MKTIRNLGEAGTLTREEMAGISGGVGWVIPILIAAGSAAVEEIIRDWDNFKAGLCGRAETFR